MEATRLYELQVQKFRLRVPEGTYWYAGYDTWVRPEGDEAVVGLTDFLQTKMGDVVFVEPITLDEIEQDDVLTTVESIKATVDVTSPATGEVLAFNDALVKHPELIGSDPYGAGWLVRLRLTDWENDQAMLLTAEAYFRVMQDKVAKALEQE